MPNLKRAGLGEMTERGSCRYWASEVGEMRAGEYDNIGNSIHEKSDEMVTSFMFESGSASTHNQSASPILPLSNRKN